MSMTRGGWPHRLAVEERTQQREPGGGTADAWKVVAFLDGRLVPEAADSQLRLLQEDQRVSHRLLTPADPAAAVGHELTPDAHRFRLLPGPRRLRFRATYGAGELGRFWVTQLLESAQETRNPGTVV
jgi:hypothetical protein